MTIADCFRSSPGATPSELVAETEIAAALSQVLEQGEVASAGWLHHCFRIGPRCRHSCP